MKGILLSLFFLVSVPSEAKRLRLIDGKTAYQVLRIRQTADRGKIETAYQEALSFSSESIENIRAAHRYLSEPTSRERYDGWLNRQRRATLVQPLPEGRGQVIGIITATIANDIERLTKTKVNLFDPLLVVRSQSLLQVHANAVRERHLSPRELYAVVSIHAFTLSLRYTDEERFALAGGALKELMRRDRSFDADEAHFYLDQVEKLTIRHAATPGVTNAAANAVLKFRTEAECNERLVAQDLP